MCCKARNIGKKIHGKKFGTRKFDAKHSINDKKFTESVSESNPNTLQFIRPICSIGQNICDTYFEKSSYHVSVVHDFDDRDATKISEKSLTVNNNNTCFP